MRNNQAPPFPPLQQTNLIYEYKCVQDDCEHLPKVSYVGLTTTTLSRRITMHLGSGGPKIHTENSHPQISLSRNAMVDNTKIIRKENDTRRLQIYEALIIQQKCPSINNQDTGSSRTLKLFSSLNNGNRGYRNQSRPAAPDRHRELPRSETRQIQDSQQSTSQPSSRFIGIDTTTAQAIEASQSTVAEQQSACTRTGHILPASQPPDKRTRGTKPSPRKTASQPERAAAQTLTMPRRSTRIRKNTKS